MGRYDDWGAATISQEVKNTEWVDDPVIYPKTTVYRRQFQEIYQTLLKYNVDVKSYLSLGTGLGRHLVIAKATFPNLDKVVTVDHTMPPHPAVKELFKDLHHYQLPVVNSFSRLLNEQYQFDLICFENIGHEHEVTSEAAITQLSQLLVPNGALAIIGDTKFDTQLLEATDLFKDISTETEWGDTTKQNLWLKV
ncbi:MAG: hypothetical protein Fur003_5500 [Candidatus Dojkabacteria bacterium]